MEGGTVSKNFIEQIIDKDIAEGKVTKVVTKSLHVFLRSQTVICISDMPSPSY